MWTQGPLSILTRMMKAIMRSNCTVFFSLSFRPVILTDDASFLRNSIGKSPIPSGSHLSTSPLPSRSAPYDTKSLIHSLSSRSPSASAGISDTSKDNLSKGSPRPGTDKKVFSLSDDEDYPKVKGYVLHFLTFDPQF